MRTARIASLLIVFVLLFASMMTLVPVQAGERLLTNNRGDASDVFFTSGEPTLVMNGFDLTPLNVLRPAWIDRVTIHVVQPVPGSPVELVIYEDQNGGSPVDATLAYRQTVTIASTGSVTLNLLQPAEIRAPVVWIGFYLPPDFHFLADQQGSSVLTYWGWTSGGTFDLSNLSSAGVFGPGDGSAPVGVDMDGVARITAEITPAYPEMGTPAILQEFQTAGDPSANLGVLFDYPDCEDIQYDTDDEFVSWQDGIDVYCEQVSTWLAPTAPEGYIRQGKLWDITVFGEAGVIAGVLDIFVTHCVDPSDEHLTSAVIGVAYGSPKVWRILPTQRFADKWVCAELPAGGLVSYFTPSILPTAVPTTAPAV